MASTIKDLPFNIVKLDHFDEGNFIHWKKQVHFLLVALKLVYVLTTPRPATNDEEEMLDDIRTKQKWDTDDEICRGHILNAMSGGLFYVDHSVTAAKEFWDKLEVRCILNRVSNKKSSITPYELWYRRKLNLKHLRVWGCRDIVKIPKSKKRKLGERDVECVFLGYTQNSKAYRFMVIEPNDSISINMVLESRDAIFDETRFTSISKEIDNALN